MRGPYPPQQTTDWKGPDVDTPIATVGDMAKAVELGMRNLFADPEFRADYWRDGYTHLSQHAGNGASQWLGKRLLTALLWAAVGAGIAWLVRLGAIK